MKRLYSVLLFVLSMATNALASNQSPLVITCEEADNVFLFVNGQKHSMECESKPNAETPIWVGNGKTQVTVIMRAYRDQFHQFRYTNFVSARDGNEIRLHINRGDWEQELSRSGLAKEGNNFVAASQAAQKGDVDAMVTVGRLYEQGAGTALDYDKALAWFTKAARAGALEAMEELGKMYYAPRFESGWVQDTEKSMFWLRTAARAVHLPAIRYVSEMYYAPRDPELPRNIDRSLALMTGAAGLGDTKAMLALARRYDKPKAGSGWPHDEEKRDLWLRKAADARDETALMWLSALTGLKRTGEEMEKIRQRMRENTKDDD